MVAFLPVTLIPSNACATAPARNHVVRAGPGEVGFPLLGTQQSNARMSVTGSAGFRSGFW